LAASGVGSALVDVIAGEPVAVEGVSFVASACIASGAVGAVVLTVAVARGALVDVGAMEPIGIE